MSLAADEVQLWYASLPQAIPAHLLTLLAPEERARAERFIHAERRQAYLSARIMVRQILAAEMGVDPAELRFTTGAHGKPALKPPDSVRFNLSHSAHRIVLAVATTEVGVDIEEIRPNVNHRALARRFFSPEENRRLADVAPGQRAAAFFATWTRKEALLKAWGVGLSRSLASFDVSVLPHEPAELLEVRPGPGGQGRWSLQHLDAGPCHAGALAVAGRLPRLRCQDWEPV